MHIPFTLPGYKGYLSPMDRKGPYTWLHVHVQKPEGMYYYGQLLFQQGKWRLPDSPLSEHAEYLGRLVEIWWEGEASENTAF